MNSHHEEPGRSLYKIQNISNITQIIVAAIQQDSRRVGINLIGQNPAANRTDDT